MRVAVLAPSPLKAASLAALIRSRGSDWHVSHDDRLARFCSRFRDEHDVIAVIDADTPDFVPRPFIRDADVVRSCRGVVMLSSRPIRVQSSMLIRCLSGCWDSTPDQLDGVLDEIAAVSHNGGALRFDCGVSILPGTHEFLTLRERQVVQCLADGMTVRECAAELGRSPSTVDNHRTAAIKKLHARNTPHLIRIAIRRGIVSA